MRGSRSTPVAAVALVLWVSGCDSTRPTPPTPPLAEPEGPRTTTSVAPPENVAPPPATAAPSPTQPAEEPDKKGLELVPGKRKLVVRYREALPCDAVYEYRTNVRGKVISVDAIDVYKGSLRVACASPRTLETTLEGLAPGEYRVKMNPGPGWGVIEGQAKITP
ncbi:MAG: hypothetical protein IPI67_32320 [Myxococcales bacterium]|nr:hypothetical protein [Myxococcales bacterium]